MNRIELGARTYDCEYVIETLKTRVTPERLERIKKVVDHRSCNLVTALENIYDPGNTYAVMRSAEAFGFHRIYQITGIQKLKETKRVSRGAEKWLIQSYWQDSTQCANHLKQQGYKIYVTHPEEGRPMDELSFKEPVALCFGNENSGISQSLVEQASEKLRIPMSGFVQSFNISVAAALCFQHIHKKHLLEKMPSLNGKERQHLLALYLYRSCGEPQNIHTGSGS